MVKFLHDAVVGVLLDSPMALITHQQVQVCDLQQQSNPKHFQLFLVRLLEV